MVPGITDTECRLKQLRYRELHAEAAGIVVREDEVLPTHAERRLTTPRFDVNPLSLR